MSANDPVSVQICGSKPLGSTVVYCIAVTGACESHIVERRFHEFAALEEHLRDVFSGLPAMPPKSLFRKHFSYEFMTERKQKLDEFIRAAVKVDSELQTPELRAFLSVDKSKILAAQAARKLRLELLDLEWAQCGLAWHSCEVVTQGDLDRLAAEHRIMTLWDQSKWKSIKTLASIQGGEGLVELMTSHEHEEQRVAVKTLPLKLLRLCPQDFNDVYPDRYERPWTDISIVKYLNSCCFPWSCELLGVYLDDDVVHIATSFANRGDLYTWCESDTSTAGVAREEVMRPIVSQLVRATCWLHNLGIAHRDLSLENVLLTDVGEAQLQVKIVDFGHATLSRMASLEVRGKPSYQAPEMHGRADYDTFLVDSFSVGVIIYCMAVHSYPWDHTLPGMDRSFEVARTYGMEHFLRKKQLPCEERPVAAVFSVFLVELLCGLLAFAPEIRHSLGEACFEKRAQRTASPKLPLSEAQLEKRPLHMVASATFDEVRSDVSTTPSFSALTSQNSGESDVEWHVEELNVSQKPRASIWDSQWLFVQNLYNVQ